MRKDIKDRWVAKLRSGEIVQGRGRLRTQTNMMCCLGVLCAIAVEDEIIAPPQLELYPTSFGYGSGELSYTEDERVYRYHEPDTHLELDGITNWTGAPPIAVREWAGLSDHDRVSFVARTTAEMAGGAYRSSPISVLIYMNDTEMLGFPEIADWIETNL